MNLRQAALREHIGIYVDDPTDICAAMRCDVDTPGMSLYHQLVCKPGGTSYQPDKIHAIASLSKYEEAKAYFRSEYEQDLKPVGKTYCVAPYTVGFARIGTKEQGDWDMWSRILTDPSYFPDYIRNWLETPEGYRAMLADISQDDPQGITPEEIDAYLLNDEEGLSPAYIHTTKKNYIRDYAMYLSPDDPYVKTRMREFKNGLKELTDEQAGRRYQQYFNMELDEEAALRDENMRDYQRSPRLLFGLWS